MFLHAVAQGQKEAECMCCQGHQGSIREPNSEADQSALQLIGYHTSRKELKDMYHSVYLLNRVPGFPSCGEVQRRRAIQEILSSLWDRIQRWTSPAEARDAPGDAGEPTPSQSYKAALWVACWKVVETAATLQSDLDRLDNELRGRPHAHSQSRGRHRKHSRSWCRTHSQEQLGDQAGAQSQAHCWVHPQDEWAHSPDDIQGPPNRWVSFCMPEGGDVMTKSEDHVTKPSIKDLESWLEHQVGQLGTPTWWRELEAIPGIQDPCKFAQKIWASSYVLEVWFWMVLGQQYSMPPAPRSLNRGAFHPERLEYQDVRQRLALLTVAYCQCLQHWAEKCYLPISPDVHPLAKSVRELCQAVNEFVNITVRDILEGLEMEKPMNSNWPPSTTIFSWVLGSPTSRQEATLVAGEIPWQNEMLRLQGRACPFLRAAPAWLPIHLPRAPTLPTFPSTTALAVVQPSTLPWGFAYITTCLRMPEPIQLDWEASTDVAAVGMMTPKISSMSTSRVVWDDSTGSVYLNTITASIGRMVLSGPDADVLSAGSMIKEVTGQE